MASNLHYHACGTTSIHRPLSSVKWDITQIFAFWLLIHFASRPSHSSVDGLLLQNNAFPSMAGSFSTEQTESRQTFAQKCYVFLSYWIKACAVASLPQQDPYIEPTAAISRAAALGAQILQST